MWVERKVYASDSMEFSVTRAKGKNGGMWELRLGQGQGGKGLGCQAKKLGLYPVGDGEPFIGCSWVVTWSTILTLGSLK